jgi:acyl-CoA synthetase (AMP-forming)/AMP-acid ligase II
MPDRSLHHSTYRDFYLRARALASGLRRAGLRKGDRVATLMWNHAPHLEAYFGIPVAGGIVHTLNIRLHPDEIAYIVNDAEDRFLIVDDILLPLFEQFKDSVQMERVFVVPLTGRPIPSAYESCGTCPKISAMRYAPSRDAWCRLSTHASSTTTDWKCRLTALPWVSYKFAVRS